MKNIIKSKKVISIIITIILLLFTTSVYAANDSFKTALSVNNSSVKKGENVTVTVSLNNISIESGEKGIGAYTAKLDFDSSVLEYVSTNGTDKWETPFYSEKQITGTTNDGKVVNTNQSIGTITFKVKDDAKLGETTIKLTNFSGSNAETDISAEDTAIKITIVNSQNSGSGSQGGSGSGSGSSGNQSGQNGTSSDKTGSGASSGNQEKLPQTGFYSTPIYILIGAFTLIAIILLVKIKLLNSKK